VFVSVKGVGWKKVEVVAERRGRYKADMRQIRGRERTHTSEENGGFLRVFGALHPLSVEVDDGLAHERDVVAVPVGLRGRGVRVRRIKEGLRDQGTAL
jgi:hypothetical protein